MGAAHEYVNAVVVASTTCRFAGASGVAVGVVAITDVWLLEPAELVVLTSTE